MTKTQLTLTVQGGRQGDSCGMLWLRHRPYWLDNITWARILLLPFLHGESGHFVGHVPFPLFCHKYETKGTKYLVWNLSAKWHCPVRTYKIYRGHCVQIRGLGYNMFFWRYRWLSQRWNDLQVGKELGVDLGPEILETLPIWFHGIEEQHQLT